MATPLIPQEIYLLERYSSKEYFDGMRVAWDQMLAHVERCLEIFMRNLPPDYRSRPLAEQPDIVWGERVLPKFRGSMGELNRAYIELTHGNLGALGAAAHVVSDARGQSEFWAGWMDEPVVRAEIGSGAATYYELLNQARMQAANINTTVGAYWGPGDLSELYDAARGPLYAPDAWPAYSVAPQHQAQTGEVVLKSGIYLPVIENSCAAFMVAGSEAPPATVAIDPKLSANIETASSLWLLVERIEGRTVATGLGDLLGGPTASKNMHAPAGSQCPEAGWWFTPARQNSRRHFRQGDVFPVIEGSAYGATFWQWSPDQSAPAL